jgi:hypothetical protein
MNTIKPILLALGGLALLLPGLWMKNQRETVVTRPAVPQEINSPLKKEKTGSTFQTVTSFPENKNFTFWIL